MNTRQEWLGRLSGVLIALATITGQAIAQDADSLPTRVIVKLRSVPAPPGEDAQQTLARMRERPDDALIASLNSHAGTTLLWAKALADGAHVFILAIRDDAPSPGEVTQRLRTAPEVAWAEQDVSATTQSLSDPGFPALWALQQPSGSTFGSDFVTAWQMQMGIASVRVAIIDTGILAHPDMVGVDGIAAGSGALADPGYDFISDCRIRATCAASTPDSAAVVEPQPLALDRGDWITNADRATKFFSDCKRRSSSWHGSHTAGIVAALANNDTGIAGAAFGATILPVRVLGKCGGYLSDVAEAIRWAAGVHPFFSNPTPARVLNLSLGTQGSCGTVMQSAIDAATSAGALVVVAAGNDALEAEKSVLPSCANVVTVAASTLQGDLAYYSNFSSTHVALSAPGGDMRSTYSAGILSLSNTGTTAHDPSGWSYVYAQGTSMAAPHVSAAAALMLSRNTALAPAQLAAILKAPASLTAFPFGSECAIQHFCGAGLLNAQRAVSNALSPLRATPSALNFGPMEPYSVAEKEVLVFNDSTASVSTGIAAPSGAAGFSLPVDQCSGRTLAPSASCRMVASFTASTNGIINGALHLPTDAGLEGVGLAIPLRAFVGSRLRSPTPSISLGDWPLGKTWRGSISFESRYGERELLAAAYISGHGAVIARDDCSSTELAPGTQCIIEVTITPSVSGTLTVQLVANTAGAGDIPYTVAITGRVVSEPAPLAGNDDGVNQISSGGGGGALPVEGLLLLALLLLSRLRGGLQSDGRLRQGRLRVPDRTVGTVKGICIFPIRVAAVVQDGRPTGEGRLG